MNSKDLYNAIGKVDDDVLEQSEVAKKKIGWLKWGALAACLCLTVGALLWPKGPQVAVKRRRLTAIICWPNGCQPPAFEPLVSA